MEKMEAPRVPQIHLREIQNSGFFYVRRRGNRRSYFCKTQAASRTLLRVNTSICKTKQAFASWSQRET